MENVADEAGIGIATLYRYYRTKSELVVAVGTHVWSNFIRDYMPIRNEDNTHFGKHTETRIKYSPIGFFFLQSILLMIKSHIFPPFHIKNYFVLLVIDVISSSMIDIIS